MHGNIHYRTGKTLLLFLAVSVLMLFVTTMAEAVEVIPMDNGTVVVQDELRALPACVRATPAVRGRAWWPVQVHTYVASDNKVTSHIIETPIHLVLVDAQQEPDMAMEVRDYADSLGKSINRIIITHAHPDHFGGILTGVFDGIPVYALEDTRQAINGGVFGIPPGEYVTNTLEPGSTSLGRVRYEFAQVPAAEAFEQLVIHLPQLDTRIVQDLAYNGYHLFLGQAEFTNWIETLRSFSLETNGDPETVLVGHGFPTDSDIYEWNMRYLKTAMYVRDNVDSGEEFQAQMIDHYPYLDGRGFINFYLPMTDWFSGTTGGM